MTWRFSSKSGRYVSVNEGRVLLTGVVRDETKEALAIRLAWKVDGVRERWVDLNNVTEWVKNQGGLI